MTYLNDLKSVVEINSYTKNKTGVDRVGELFDKWFNELGFHVEIHERELIGSHRYYISKYNKNAKRLLLLGHLDTVFPPEKFETYHEDAEWVYGPGVCDMKGGNIVALQALREIKKQKIEIQNIDILLVSDEETGSDDSKFLTAKIAKNYDYCFVYEAAGVELEVVAGRKGVGTFFIEIEGRAAHAGNCYSEGHDANLEASYKLQELVKLTDLSKGTTVNVGKMEGGTGANTISPHAQLTFEIRYKVAHERDRVLKSIDAIVERAYVFGTISKLRGTIQRDVMQTSDNSLELVKKIQKVTNTALKYEERGGASDANTVSSCGVVTLDGFGPYGDGDHTLSERANKKSFKSRIELSRALFAYFIKKSDF